ncbi:MAG: rod shape-determining protein MreC [Verrucomicrobiales bacterium]|nr:rod shape-determining protein MreC [Verrucomicrobiales bacterium]
MKKSNLVALVTFLLALVWVFTLDNKGVHSVQSKVLGLFGLAHETVVNLTYDEDVINGEPISANELYRKYEKEQLALRYNKSLKELFELRAWQGQIDLLREENIELKRSLNFVEYKGKQNQKLVTARVIKRQSNSWWRTIIIDKGYEDGVMINSPVMTPVAVERVDQVEGALVGKIASVGQSQSTIVLATDVECKVSAYVHSAFAEPSGKGQERVQGILSGAPGAGREVTHLLLQNLPKEADRYGVSAGAKVYSSGVGNSETKGIFPPGLLLGYVKEFEVKEFDAVARVQPAINFNQLSYVFILVPNTTQEVRGQASVTGELPSNSNRLSNDN